MLKYMLLALAISLSANVGIGLAAKNLSKKNSENKKKISSLESQIKNERELQGIIDSARREHLERLGNAKSEISDLRASNRRLLVSASCPKMPGSPAGTGNGKAELSGNARQSYYDLREGIKETQSLLDLCVKTIKGGSHVSNKIQ